MRAFFVIAVLHLFSWTNVAGAHDITLPADLAALHASLSRAFARMPDSNYPAELKKAFLRDKRYTEEHLGAGFEGAVESQVSGINSYGSLVRYGLFATIKCGETLYVVTDIYYYEGVNVLITYIFTNATGDWATSNWKVNGQGELGDLIDEYRTDILINCS